MFLSFALKGRGLKPSPLARTSGFVQYVFRWGIGTDYTLRNRLRFLPPTLPRPKERTVAEDYFKETSLREHLEGAKEGVTQLSPHKICYCSVNEQWEVFWWENLKEHAKPFPIRKYGIERAKREAIDFAKYLYNSSRMEDSPHHDCEKIRQSIPNVFWDEKMQVWFCVFRDKLGKSKTFSFSANKWGYKIAKEKAVEIVSNSSTGKWSSRLEKLAQSISNNQV